MPGLAHGVPGSPQGADRRGNYCLALVTWTIESSASSVLAECARPIASGGFCRRAGDIGGSTTCTRCSASFSVTCRRFSAACSKNSVKICWWLWHHGRFREFPIVTLDTAHSMVSTFEGKRVRWVMSGWRLSWSLQSCQCTGGSHSGHVNIQCFRPPARLYANLVAVHSRQLMMRGRQWGPIGAVAS